MPTATPPRGCTKIISVRVTPEEHRLLHRKAPQGGIQSLVRAWIDPRLAELKRQDEECDGR
jgi:hypothetical protein